MSKIPSKDFLLEIGTEEIPAFWLNDASRKLLKSITNFLSEKEITYIKTDTKKACFFTPRRVAILLKKVAKKQKDKVIEITGPPVEQSFDSKGKLTKAALGFAKAHGVKPSDLKTKKKGQPTKQTAGRQEVICCVKKQKGQKTKDILKSALPELIKKLDFPKSMRWETTNFRFARPIRWIVALFGEEVIPFEIAGVKSGRESYGLRFTPSITIKLPSSYETELARDNIVVRFDNRLEAIRKGIEDLKKKLKQRLKLKEKLEVQPGDLYYEVANLVECPLPILGKFDAKYLELPKEVIIAALKSHQRYFALRNPDGTLAPYFVVVANSKDGDIDEIEGGHERVLKARLADAEFYYKEDIKIPLEKRIDELKGITWWEGLGTLYDKTQRLVKFSEKLTGIFKKQNIDVNWKDLREAAMLSKVDLLTDMIKDGKEFTKLEGLYGGILAEKQGKGLIVKKTIEDQYLIRFLDSPEQIILALANKMDNIAGTFVLGKIPTGSSDPSGIRSEGNDVVSILLDNNIPEDIHINLRDLIAYTLDSYKKSDTATENAVFEFLLQRLRRYLEGQRIRYDIIDAVLETKSDDLLDLYERAQALNKLIGQKKFITLVTLAKRVRNILKTEEVKKLLLPRREHYLEIDDSHVGIKRIPPVQKELLEEKEEQFLDEQLMSGEREFNRFLKQRNYKQAIDWLLDLARPINDLFDKVLIMVEDKDLRRNRLALLHYLSTQFFQKVADFSKIVS